MDLEQLLSELSADALRYLCRQLDLPVSGTKAELADHIRVTVPADPAEVLDMLRVSDLRALLTRFGEAGLSAWTRDELLDRAMIFFSAGTEDDDLEAADFIDQEDEIEEDSEDSDYDLPAFY